jgi:amino acid transporter
VNLKRELGLRDLTLFSIACIIGTRWIASAAHAGSGSLLLWVLAALFFLIPSAVASAALTARHPQAGGIYVWTRHDFGPWNGFLAFWIYWMAIVIWFPSAAMFYVSIALPSLAANRIGLLAASLAVIWIALGTNLFGLKMGKWTENIGAIASWVLAAILVIVAWRVWSTRGSATTFHLMPAFTWDTVSFLATIAYALSGLEVLGLMGGEIRNPERILKRAAGIAAIFTTIFYIAVTASLLVILPAEKISELNGFIQVASATGIVWLPAVVAILVLATAIGQFGGLGSSVSRLPFAAGVDHLMPAAFAKIHPRWATPHISILIFGALASALLIAMQLGDTIREAYQTLVSLMVIAGFLPYMYMFGSAWLAGKRLSALSGWATTLLAIVCAVVPSADIHNVWLFELKLAAGTTAVIASAWFVYRSRAGAGTKRSAP